MTALRLVPAVLVLLLAGGCGTYEVPVGQPPQASSTALDVPQEIDALDDVGEPLPSDLVGRLPDPLPDALVGRWVERGEGSAAFVELLDDGQARLDDGCHAFTGLRWSVGGDAVTLEGTRSRPAAACTGAADSWPARVTGFRLDGERLVALDEDGAPLTTLEDGDDVVVGVPLRHVGTWRVQGEPGEPFVRFAPEGEVVGNDGCNGFSQQGWRLESDVVAVSVDRLTSMMACGDGRGDWIDDVVAYRSDGTSLVAVDAEGDRVATLTRVE